MWYYITAVKNALVAQLDRVTGYEPVGRGFESLQARQAKKTSQNVMSFVVSGGTSRLSFLHFKRAKKALRIAVLFLFYTAIETLSFSHFLTAHNPPLFCKSKTTPAFFDHRQNLIQRAPTVVSFLILT